MPIPRWVLGDVAGGGLARVLVELEVAEDAARGPRSSPAFDAEWARVIAAARVQLGAALGRSGWHSLREFASVPFVALEVDAAALERLSKAPGVRGIGEDRLERPFLRETGPLVGAPEAEAMGFDGRGWSVAIIDTGVESAHTFMGGRVIDQACFSAGRSCPNGAAQQFGIGAGEPCSWAPDSCGHGTHVAGIAAGRGQTTDGMAPEASIVSLQVFSRFTGSICEEDSEDPCALTYTSDTIAALDWLYQNRDRLNLAVVNMSLGGESFTSEAACDAADAGRKAAVDALRAAGIATIAAAGNDGSADSLATPACLSSVISVGATTDEDEIASFSQSASFLDLLAPGRSVVSAYPPGDWASVSGTSQATPHVAGGFALLYQKLGRRDPDAALAALRDSGVWITDARNGQVTSRIRLAAALDALGGGPNGTGVQVTPDGVRTLVSKDVGEERWAITLDHADGSVTGNVFRSGGGQPQFVFCEPLAGAAAGSQRYSCSGSDSCAGSACTPAQWVPISVVDVPLSFFAPGGDPAEASGPAAPTAAVEPGLQITPDRAHTLVSKDVGPERWAIGRHADGTVTGNVFLADGSDPQFVWCEQIGSDGNPDPAAEQLLLSCHGADRCSVAPCTASQWIWLRDVTVPGAFFLP